MDIDANIQLFLGGSGKHKGVQPEERYASFDYCYNYFQSFREQGRAGDLAAPENMQISCLQVGFYLASWGMLRGSTFLMFKSIKFYEPLIEYIAHAHPKLWEIDADCYTEENIALLLECEEKIVAALAKGGYASATLVTKIMLGVFGSIPAFDSLFVKGFRLRWRRAKSLRVIRAFYEDNKAAIDRYQIPTIDFQSGQPTHRFYPKAKLIDMIGFIEGQRPSAFIEEPQQTERAENERHQGLNELVAEAQKLEMY